MAANVTTFADGTVRQNRKYYYRVRAYHATGVSAYSNVAGAATPRK